MRKICLHHGNPSKSWIFSKQPKKAADARAWVQKNHILKVMGGIYFSDCKHFISRPGMGFATGFDLLFKISGGGKALLLSAIFLGIDVKKQ